MPEALDRWAKETPDALAVSEGPGGLALTFAELRERAERLAAHLRRLGVRPEMPVAVSLPRSAELIVAMLGVWKAGGCYLPLDPG